MGILENDMRAKVRPPIEFLNVGVTNPLIAQLLLSDNFFMKT